MKNITDFFIKRPVFAICLNLILFIMGLIAFNHLLIRQYPQMSANAISISTNYKGAKAESVESFVTTKIENAISGIDNIDYIKSSSSAGKSQVVVYLKLNSDVNSALEDINSNLASIIKNFPDAIDNPIVKKMDPDASASIIVTFSSSKKSAPEITDYLTHVISPQLTLLSGLGSVDIIGNRTYAMRLWLNPLKMASLHISAQDIEDALKKNNATAQAGSIRREQQNISINAETDLHSPEDFRQLIIKNQGNQLLRMMDVASIELGAESYTKSLSINNKIGVGIGMTFKPTANPLSVSQEVKKTLSRLEKQLPEDMKMSYARDNSIYIKKSIDEVALTILESTFFVFFIIFLFLGSLRATLIPLITIPLALTSTFIFMFAMGFSINILTLLAFVFAVGLVVDDAIVVLENIHRHIESGLSPLNAAIKGAREIVFVIIAITITLIAVYFPIGFTNGLSSTLFKEFAFTLAAAIFVSGFTALTLSPMMCSKLMRPIKKESILETKVNHYLSRLTSYYEILLNMTLKKTVLIIISMIFVLILGAIFFIPLYATSTLAPNEDQGIIIGKGSAPSGANIHYTEKYTHSLRSINKIIPEITESLIINGQGSENNSTLIFQLVDWSKRDKSSSLIIKELSKIAHKITGMKFYFFNPSSLPGSTSTYSTEFIIKSIGSYEELYSLSQEISKKLEENPGIISVDTDLELDNPEISLRIDRNKAASLGVNIEDINTTLNLALGEPDISSFVKNGQSYNVIPQLSPNFNNDAEKLNNLYVKTENDSFIPLSNLIQIQQFVNAGSLNHFQEQRAATLHLVLSENYSEKEAIENFIRLLKQKNIPEYISYDFSGDTRQFIYSNNTILTIFIFSLVFIYLILSAQFESFIYPLIILLTVPLALVGALITLYMVNASLNIYTEIGLITLIGLISKHGILMVEFANQLQKNNISTHDAIKKSAAVRLRPILMTTATMILSAIPLIFANGPGSVARSQIGWTLIGGLFIGTLLTLFVIPSMYILFSPNKKNKS